MRRLLTFALLIAALSTALVALPTLTTASARPRPVPASVERIPLAALEAGLRTTGALRTDPRRTRPFSLMGVTWRPDPAIGEVSVVFRSRTGGRWTEWESVDADNDDAPDAGSADLQGSGVRVGTAPIWTGPSDGVQVRVESRSGATP